MTALAPMQRDVTLTIDEMDLILAVTDYAMTQLGRPQLSSALPEEGQPPSVVEMKSLNAIGSMAFWPRPIRRSISREDLAFLAPYIDDWIAGKAPPRDLPAEYKDWRPQTLREFKDRMKRKGLWPESSAKLGRG